MVSAHALGAWGRGFESRLPDMENENKYTLYQIINTWRKLASDTMSLAWPNQMHPRTYWVCADEIETWIISLINNNKSLEDAIGEENDGLDYGP